MGVPLETRHLGRKGSEEGVPENLGVPLEGGQTELKQLSRHIHIHVYSFLSLCVYRIERGSLVISLFYFTILLLFL